MRHLFGCALLFAMLLPRQGFAQEGSLDPAFGPGGKVTTDFAGDLDQAFAVTIQTDGKIVVVGYADTATGTDFALARYDADGTLDATFGTGGKTTTDFGGDDDQAWAVALQADGKIVVAGRAVISGTSADFALARYTPDGTLDATFGTGGKTTTDFGGFSDRAFALALESGGKIVVAGRAVISGTSADFALARYTPDGTLDATFGTAGKATTDFGGDEDSAFALALQTDGKLVVAGSAFFPGPGTGEDFALARYDADGTLDTTFGTGGKATTDFGGPNDAASGVALQPDGKAVVAGRSYTGTSRDFAVVRYHADGSLDTTFGAGGKVTTDFGGDEDSAFALALQTDGKIVVVGYADTATGTDFALARYDADGTLDATFGTGGKATTDFGGDDDQAFAVALQTDGKIVAAGRAGSGGGTDFDFALARYDAAAGLPAACLDPTTAPSYAGGYVLNSAKTRAFVVVSAPRGGITFVFYDTHNLVVGDPETDTESMAALPGLTRAGDTFSFSAGNEPTTAYFPITTGGAGTGVRFYLRVTDTCDRTVDVDPAFAITGVGMEQMTGFALAPAMPNPTAGLATIHFSLGTAGQVTLGVYDVLGREVARLAEGVMSQGAHGATLDASSLPSGLYVYRLTTGGGTFTRPLTVAR